MGDVFSLYSVAYLMASGEFHLYRFIYVKEMAVAVSAIKRHVEIPKNSCS